MEEKKVIRAAIIGSGQIARTSHIPAYRSMENVEIVAVSDANEAAAQRLAEDFVKFIQGEKPSLACTSIFDSVAGHLAVNLADESREHGGQPQKVEY